MLRMGSGGAHVEYFLLKALVAEADYVPAAMTLTRRTTDAAALVAAGVRGQTILYDPNQGQFVKMNLGTNETAVPVSPSGTDDAAVLVCLWFKKPQPQHPSSYVREYIHISYKIPSWSSIQHQLCQIMDFRLGSDSR